MRNPLPSLTTPPKQIRGPGGGRNASRPVADPPVSADAAPTYRLGDRQVAGFLAVMAVALFGFAARLRLLHATPAGDEPHYLVFNVALAKYRTLNVMPVYENRDYWSFYPALLEPHVAPAPGGLSAALHGFGGPLLWHPLYLLWGRAGAAAFMVAVSALLVLNVFFFLRELGIVRAYAGLVAALFAIGSPIYVYSSMLFVEPIGALAVIYAVRVLCRRTLDGGRLALAATGLGILPWVHARFTVFAVLLGAMLLWRVARETRRRALRPYAAFLTPIALLIGAFLVYNVAVWHSLNPLAANASHGDNEMVLPYAGLAGLLLDRSYGLLSNFPLLILAIPGVLLALRRDLLRQNVAVAVAVVPYLAAVSTYFMWYGGYSPPSRLLVAVVPLLAYPVAVTLQRLHHWLAVTAAILLTLFGATLSITSDVVPTLRWNWPTWPQAQAMKQLGAMLGFDFARLVPSSFLHEQTKIFAAWIIAIAAIALLIALVGRRAPTDRLTTSTQLNRPAADLEVGRDAGQRADRAENADRPEG